jgi:hypothetical protein
MKKLIVALPIILIVIGIALNSYAVLHFFSQKTPQLISTHQTRPITSSQSPTLILPSPPTTINSPTSGSSLLFMLNQQTRCQDNILLTQKFRKFLKP